MGATEESGNLFARKLVLRRDPMIRRRPAPEALEAARALCHQLPRKRTSAEKRRVVHLICLNLLAILKHRSRQL
jgi:hypothetical protein